MNSGLPSFSLDCPIKANEGMFDRLEVDYGPILLGIDHLDQGQRFADHLSIPPERRRMMDTGVRYGILFNRYTGRQRFKVEIRKGSVHLYDGVAKRPLFGGRFTVLKSRATAFSSGYASMSLNPTRFLRYQKTRGMFLNGKSNLRNWPVVLFANATNPHGPDEFSFDGNDNWVPPFSYNRTAQYGWSQPLLRRYLGGVIETLKNEVLRAGSVLDAEPSLLDATFNLKRAEIYWEFSDADPVATINQLLQRLGTISKKQTARNFGRFRGQDGLCVIYGYRLASGIWLYVYAKTNKRIRFEIRYSLKKAAKTLKEGHASKSRTDLIRYLQRLRTDASIRLREFLAFLKDESMPPKIPVSATALVTRIVSVVRFHSPS